MPNHRAKSYGQLIKSSPSTSVPFSSSYTKLLNDALSKKNPNSTHEDTIISISSHNNMENIPADNTFIVFYIKKTGLHLLAFTSALPTGFNSAAFILASNPEHILQAFKRAPLFKKILASICCVSATVSNDVIALYYLPKSQEKFWYEIKAIYDHPTFYRGTKCLVQVSLSTLTTFSLSVITYEGSKSLATISPAIPIFFVGVTAPVTFATRYVALTQLQIYFKELFQLILEQMRSKAYKKLFGTLLDITLALFTAFSAAIPFGIKGYEAFEYLGADMSLEANRILVGILSLFTSSSLYFKATATLRTKMLEIAAILPTLDGMEKNPFRFKIFLGLFMNILGCLNMAGVIHNVLNTPHDNVDFFILLNISELLNKIILAGIIVGAFAVNFGAYLQMLIPTQLNVINNPTNHSAAHPPLLTKEKSGNEIKKPLLSSHFSSNNLEYKGFFNPETNTRKHFPNKNQVKVTSQSHNHSFFANLLNFFNCKKKRVKKVQVSKSDFSQPTPI